MKKLFIIISGAAMLCLAVQAVPVLGKPDTVARDWPINLEQVSELDVMAMRNATSVG